MAEKMSQDRRLVLIATIFSIVNIGFGWLLPAVRDHYKVTSLEAEIKQIKLDMEEAKEENKGDHSNIQSKVESIDKTVAGVNISVVEIATNLKYLRESIQQMTWKPDSKGGGRL